MNPVHYSVKYLAAASVGSFGYSYPNRRDGVCFRSHVQGQLRLSRPCSRIPENHCAKYEPRRLMQGVVGKMCGEIAQATALPTAQRRETVDVNESLHEAEIAVKQISKCPIYWGFLQNQHERACPENHSNRLAPPPVWGRVWGTLWDSEGSYKWLV